MNRYAALLVALLACPNLSAAQVSAAQMVSNRDRPWWSDTTFAQAVLMDALEAFTEWRRDPRPRNIELQFVLQLTRWGLHDEAWRFGMARDSALAGAQEYEVESHLPYIIEALHQKGQLASIESRIDRLPASARDRVLAQTVRSGQCGFHSLDDRMLQRIQSHFQRARALANKGLRCSHADQPAARDLLRSAIELAGDSITGRRAYEVTNWLFTLKKIGGAVSVNDLVQTVLRDIGDLHAARHSVISRLGTSDPEVAMLLDSVLEHYSRLTARPYRLLANLHELRGTRSDSAIALALRDTAARLSPPPGLQPTNARFRLGEILSSLQNSIDSLDRATIRPALAAAVESRDPVGLIVSAADFMRARVIYERTPPDPVAVTDARIEFADFLSNELWRASDQLAVDARDSARVAVIALLVAFDEQQAVNSYRQLQVLRMRDRAAAEIVQRMVNTDADAAAVLAEPLEDTIARNKAFSALAQRAVAGGRLVSATRFADRTVSGEARVSAQLALANALFAVDSTTEARARIIAVLPHLNPVARCEECVHIMSDTTVLRPEMPGMSYFLISQVVGLAFRLGALEELRAWARSRPTAETRAHASLTLVQNM